jgi:hypothetical protein
MPQSLSGSGELVAVESELTRKIPWAQTILPGTAGSWFAGLAAVTPPLLSMEGGPAGVRRRIRPLPLSALKAKPLSPLKPVVPFPRYTGQDAGCGI